MGVFNLKRKHNLNEQNFLLTNVGLKFCRKHQLYFKDFCSVCDEETFVKKKL